MSDLISREAAQNITTDLLSGYLTDEVREVVEKIEADLGELQSAQQWIPCSERLPEKIKAVIITWVNRKPVPYYSHIKDKPFTATGIYCRGQWYWYSTECEDFLEEHGEREKYKFDNVDQDIHIIAWQPLPEPYREVENETD